MLVNNAGEQTPAESILDLTQEQLVRTFQTNIFSMFYLVTVSYTHLAIEFDKESLIVRKNSNVVSFTASELKIFSKLFSSPGRVYTKAQLYELISASSHGGGEDRCV